MSHTVFCSFKKQKLEAGPSAPKVESDEATGSEGKQQKLFRHITWYVWLRKYLTFQQFLVV